jgi:hypothetical protein
MTMKPAAVIALLICSLAAAQAPARTWTVCPANSKLQGCDFKGDKALPDAIDKAVSDDTIKIRAGRYAPASYKDLPYGKLQIRGYALIDGKNLSLIGEPGAVLDGSTQMTASGIVVNRATVTIRDLEITGFRYEIEEDDIYDGHGIFLIDSKARIDNVTISRFQKMGLTGRGDSLLDVSNLRILDGHVGIWLHETAYLRLRNGIVRGNHSSGLSAYDNSVAHIANSAFDGNDRYGLYANQQAALFVTDSIVQRNKLGGAYSLSESRISLDYSVLFGNAKDSEVKDNGQVRLGANLVATDPMIDADYRLRAGSPLAGKGDPDLHDASGALLQIGPIALPSTR